MSAQDTNDQTVSAGSGGRSGRSSSRQVSSRSPRARAAETSSRRYRIEHRIQIEIRQRRWREFVGDDQAEFDYVGLAACALRVPLLPPGVTRSPVLCSRRARVDMSTRYSLAKRTASTRVSSPPFPVAPQRRSRQKESPSEPVYVPLASRSRGFGHTPVRGVLVTKDVVAQLVGERQASAAGLEAAVDKRPHPRRPTRPMPHRLRSRRTPKRRRAGLDQVHARPSAVAGCSWSYPSCCRVLVAACSASSDVLGKRDCGGLSQLKLT